MVKNPPANSRDTRGRSSTPGSGRSPGEGKGYPLHYSCLENSMDCIIYRVTKSRTQLSNFHSLKINNDMTVSGTQQNVSVISISFQSLNIEKMFLSPGNLKGGTLPEEITEDVDKD